MIELKEKVGVLPEVVETDNYPSLPSRNAGGVVRIDVDSSSGTIRVVPSAVTELCRSVVESCFEPPLVDDALPEYRPLEIEYESRHYIFREPLECEVSWELESYFIRYRPFGITVASPVLSAAREEFAFEFAHDYERYNELSCADNKFGLRLGAHLEGIRRLMNAMVVSVIDL
jgi:hypothetical protein